MILEQLVDVIEGADWIEFTFISEDCDFSACGTEGGIEFSEELHVPERGDLRAFLSVRTIDVEIKLNVDEIDDSDFQPKFKHFDLKVSSPGKSVILEKLKLESYDFDEATWKLVVIAEMEESSVLRPES